VIFSSCRRIFDNGIRGNGGVAQARPSWETTPTDYPIKTLPWGAFMDATDNTNIVLDASGTVATWRSSVVSTENYYLLDGLPHPFRFFLKGMSNPGSNPTINGGTANPSATQHISFDGSQSFFQSGARAISSTRWAYSTYSDTHGGGGNEGYWSDGGTQTFTQLTSTAVPNNFGGPRFVSANSDTLEGSMVMSDLFSNVLGGTITLGFFGDAAAAANLGTLTAQTGYLNPGIFSTTATDFGIHFSDAGVTVCAYDGVNRDVGGGPNDGWQQVTVSLAVFTDAVIQVRWGGGNGVLALRVITASGWGSWQTCAFSDLTSYADFVRLGANYSLSAYLDGLIYELSTAAVYLSDLEADAEVRHLASNVGIDISEDNAIKQDAYVLFGQRYAIDSTSFGFLSFTVGRANSRTTTSDGYLAKSFWQTKGSTYYIGLGSTDQSGAKWTPNVTANDGVTYYNLNQSVSDDTWALVSMHLDAGILRSRKDGDASTDTSVYLSSPYRLVVPGGQHFTMGYAEAPSAWLSSAVAFFAASPSAGWTDARIRDVERYLNATYMTGAPVTGSSYDPFGTLGFFGM